MASCYNDVQVLMEILLRLPAKALIRFQSVCRQWLRLISSDEFRRLHTLRRHKPQPSLILRHPKASGFFYFRPFSDSSKFVPFILPHPKIVSSCNGLLLLQQMPLDMNRYYVYNPTTNQSRKIILTDDIGHVLGLNLAFDPSISPHYKIVCVRAAREPPPPNGGAVSCRIELYDSESHKWRVCLESFIAPRSTCFSDGVYCNNVIHWGSGYPDPHLYLYTNKSDVVGVIPRAIIPRCHESVVVNALTLHESNGRLYHWVILWYNDQLSVVVHELQQDYSGWSLKYHQELDLGRVYHICRILSYDGETDTAVIQFPGEIVAYRFLDKSFVQLVDLRKQPSYHQQLNYALRLGYKNLHNFSQTLALV